jgi:SAM-dependent methyltransferase
VSEPQLIEAVDAYYTAKLRSHGTTPAGVDWNDEASQRLRFEQLLALVEPADEPFSVIDYGCGYGALVDALQARTGSFEYQGYDVSRAMVDEASQRYIHHDQTSFTADRHAVRRANFTVASGIFNVKLAAPIDEWARYVVRTIEDMIGLSTKGIAFNALTAHADEVRKRPDLFYADPAQLLDHCLRRYSRDVAVRHDYGLYEFTVLVRLDRRPPAVPPQGGAST